MGAADAATRDSRAMGERPSTLAIRSPQRSGVSGSAGNTRKSGATKNPGYGRPTFVARPPRSRRRAATVRGTTRSAREFGLTMGHPIIRAAGVLGGAMIGMLIERLTAGTRGSLM